MRRAFTLIEMIVVIAITTVVITALTTMIVYFYRTNTYAIEEAQAVGQARNGIESTLKYMREASYANDGTYPISVATPNSVTIYSDMNNGPLVQQITYTLTDGTLYQTVGTPTGYPLSYLTATFVTNTVATYVVNDPSTPVFRYYDSTGAELTGVFSVKDIRFITTTLVVDVNTTRTPVAFTLSGGATLRNIRNSL